MKGIAYRRQQRERMIAHAKRIMKTWANDPSWIDWAATRWADNMKKCSCDMCGNPRRHEGATIQEERFKLNERDDAKLNQRL